MKKIYTFTLESEDYPSRGFDSNLRLVAYMLYDTIYNYDEGYNPLDVNKNIVYNKIHETYYGNGYYFDSDEMDDSLINYEPFIVGKKTFGFTINDELMSREVIDGLVMYVLNLLRLNYKVTINSFDYEARDREDERYRSKAIRLIFESLGCKIDNRSGFVKRLMNYTGGIRRRLV